MVQLKAYNEAVYEVMVKQAREKDPERFDHEQRYTAYHEAGHASMEMLFYRDLKRVSIIPFFRSWDEIQRNEEQVQKAQGWHGAGGVCSGIDHDLERMNAGDGAFHSFQQTALLLAGKAGGDIFCTCEKHAGTDGYDQEDPPLLLANAKPEARQRLISAVSTVIHRHRPQLDAIAQALIENETLSGSQVFEAMVASGWDPETDVDPEQFYSEALGIAADETADDSIGDKEAA